MPKLFWLHLALAFIVGSIWVTLTTILAERFGSKVSGFIGGLPSTAVISFFTSKFAGPIFGGVFSAFPAVFISILIITYRSKDIEFSRAITKPLLVTGMITIVVYGMGVRYFYPSLGLASGTALAYGLAMVSAFFTSILIQKRLA